jgi:hypothetical protein
MNPTPSSIRSNNAPPTTTYITSGVPRSGETATAIASNGAREVPKWRINARSVVQAYVYIDSVLFAADVQCQLANPANLEDERTLYEMEMLKRQGEFRKLRPCVVIKVVQEAGLDTGYLLCPMAGFHKNGSRQLYKDLEEPASLLVRPVQTTDNNETFGAYVAYQFIPEWDDGPQYLFPVQVLRRNAFVTNHWLRQNMDDESFERLQEDIEEVSSVWKKWRNAEHVVVNTNEPSQ